MNGAATAAARSNLGQETIALSSGVSAQSVAIAIHEILNSMPLSIG